MSPDCWLVLPPQARREGLPLLARTRSTGIARLDRNDLSSVRELIVRDLAPAAPDASGAHFGPLDDLAIIRVTEQVEDTGVHRLLAAFAPTRRQLMAVLLLGVGPAEGRWAGVVFDAGVVRSLTGLTLVGACMTRIPAVASAPPSADALKRWSRTRGAMGDPIWRRVRASRVAVVGAGRNGSAAALGLAMLGVSKLVLIDGDVEERHNLDATVGATPEGIGLPKVENRRRTLTAIRPDDLEVVAVPHALRHTEAVEALRDVDLIVTCVDRDAPRLAAARLTNHWAKIHLDVGTGVFRDQSARRVGGDVRLLLPGEACVACLGGLRNTDEARAELESSSSTLRHGPPPQWQTARAGSLLTLNQMAVNLGIQVWLDLLAGVRNASCWVRLEWGQTPSVVVTTGTSGRCRICRGGSIR